MTFEAVQESGIKLAPCFIGRCIAAQIPERVPQYVIFVFLTRECGR
jgi:hypothetical protein